MKNKQLLLLLLILFSALFIVGCSSDDSGESTQNGETSESSSGIDESLTGADLLNSLDITSPDSLKMTSVSTGINGINTTMTTMLQSGNSRMEMEVPDVGNQVIIYNAAEGVTYQYVEGQTTGLIFSDSDLSSDSEEFETEEELTTSISDLTEDLSNMIDARVETLNGETVIYIETTEDGGEEGLMDVKMWYSTEYGVPLKYELYAQGELIASTEVTEISSEPLDNSLFDAPDGVEFMDFASMSFEDLSDLYPTE